MLKWNSVFMSVCVWHVFLVNLFWHSEWSRWLNKDLQLFPSFFHHRVNLNNFGTLMMWWGSSTPFTTQFSLLILYLQVVAGAKVAGEIPANWDVCVGVGGIFLTRSRSPRYAILTFSMKFLAYFWLCSCLVWICIWELSNLKSEFSETWLTAGEAAWCKAIY